MQKERRKYIRSKIKIYVLCLVPNKSQWLDVFTASAENISRKGILLKSYEMICHGTEIFLQFYLPYIGSHFTVSSKVVWSRFDGFITGLGLRFTNIGAKYQEIIEHYVLKHYNLQSPLE